MLRLSNVSVDNAKNRIHVFFTPTVPHCSASTLIGLSIRVKLMRSLPSRYKIDVAITPGAHMQEAQVNKQYDVEGLCQGVPKRMKLWQQKQGGRLKK